jgi:lambda family phage tail tape measure protein
LLNTTGKASFKEFTTSILKMIVQVINQLIVAYTIQAAMGWISGGQLLKVWSVVCRSFLSSFRF